MVTPRAALLPVTVANDAAYKSSLHSEHAASAHTM
jgi:hypothetical protein